ncbi:hypothetical protein GcC1_181052b [Golovinomyces cichoracearum]|uniref:Uncharacterized protein n=1 Tax=Golovinomyces cichoracearum TaxID=62708 RepID=A0A420HMH4_9PEZI|nr:hypothetical protein GcC1_181052b [Golovinomyces cichoracearum]
MEFSHHIKSLQPPEKFDGNSEMFHSRVLEMIDYFQNKEKLFGKSSNKGLFVFEKSRLDGKPANLIYKATMKGSLTRELTKIRFNNDDYNEFLCELDDFFCRDYISRQLLAGSKRPQTSNLDDAKSNNSSDSKSGHKNQAGNPPVAFSKAKEKGSAQFNNQKLGLKEELRELDRSEGRCYYCH